MKTSGVLLLIPISNLIFFLLIHELSLKRLIREKLMKLTI